MTPLPSQKYYAIVAILRNRKYVAELCNKELIELFNSIECVKVEGLVNQVSGNTVRRRQRRDQAGRRTFQPTWTMEH